MNIHNLDKIARNRQNASVHVHENGYVARWLEHSIHNAGVGGSSPPVATSKSRA